MTNLIQFQKELLELSSYLPLKLLIEEDYYTTGKKKIKDESVEIILFGKKYKIHKNVNLYIDICKQCSADCKFCIAKTNVERKTQKNTRQYLRNLDLILGELKKKINPSITITGGEPTIDKKLKEIFDLVSKHGMRKPIMVSNAQRLSKFSDYINRPKGLQHINISRHHFDDRKNAVIFNSTKIPSKEQIKKSIEKIKDKSKIRFNTNVVKGGIDNYSDLLTFLKFTSEFGIKHVSLAELTSLKGSEKVYKQEIIDYTEENRILIDSMIERAKKDSDFTMIKEVKGPYYYAPIFKHKPTGITLVFKKTDAGKMAKFEKEQGTDSIAELIFTTTGDLEGSWIPGQRVIKKFNYN